MDQRNTQQLVNSKLEAGRRDAANRRLVARARHRKGARIRTPRASWFGGHRPARHAPNPTTA